MLTKKLRKIGNSRGIVLDKGIWQVANIDDDTELKIEVHGSKIVIEALTPENEFDDAYKNSRKNLSNAFKRLAQ